MKAKFALHDTSLHPAAAMTTHLEVEYWGRPEIQRVNLGTVPSAQVYAHMQRRSPAQYEGDVAVHLELDRESGTRVSPM